MTVEWHVIETLNPGLGSIEGFIDDKGFLIVIHDDKLNIFLNEFPVMGDFLKNPDNELYINKPEEYAGSWSYVGKGYSSGIGDANTRYPLQFQRKNAHD